jgi:hypothetical protein
MVQAVRLMALTNAARSVVGTVAMPSLDTVPTDPEDEMDVDKVATSLTLGLSPEAVSFYLCKMITVVNFHTDTMV